MKLYKFTSWELKCKNYIFAKRDDGTTETIFSIYCFEFGEWDWWLNGDSVSYFPDMQTYEGFSKQEKKKR